MAQVRCLAEHHGERFAAYNGDCVSVLRQLPDECIDFSVYSPPFGSLFVYSDSAADMGNSTDEQFRDHYAFLVREKLRLTNLKCMTWSWLLWGALRMVRIFRLIKQVSWLMSVGSFPWIVSKKPMSPIFLPLVTS